MRLESLTDDRLFRELAESTQQALLASERGKICFANAAACRLLGASAPQAVVGQPFDAVFDEAACVRLSGSSSAEETFSTVLRRLDGSSFGARVQAKTLSRDDERKSLSLVPLAETMPSLDATWVLEAMPMGVLAIDQQGTIRLVNSALERMFACGRAALLGQPVETLLPERFRGGHAGLRATYWQDPTPRAMGQGRELYALRADGSEFPIEIGLNPIQTPDGFLVLAAVVDVTERQLMESAFKRLFEAAPFGMIMVTEEGEIALANYAAERLFGYAHDELLGTLVAGLLPERYRAGHAAHRASFKAKPEPRIMGSGRDLTALHKNGLEVPVEIGLTPIRWQGKFMVVAAITDISARKRMERDLRQANQHMEEFTYVASHDLKSPLRGIDSLVQWIGEDIAELGHKDIENNLARINDRIHRMEQTIDDVLKFARAGRASTDFVMTDPSAVIADVLAIHQPPKGFEVVVRADVEPFVAAKLPIETVLRNLIDNTFKHHGSESGRVEITVENEDSFCLFTVTDDGDGIPAQSHDRVFRMFQTVTASERQGSGMGLTLSKRLVEAHGGRIALESNEGGKGVTFKVWWPRFLRKENDDQG